MRASEIDKPLLRISNNGISGIIDKYGKVLKSTKLNKSEMKIVSLHHRDLNF